MARLKGALTLVEVITCVAIIALVAAIAYPLIVRAKRAASETACVSNLGQIYATISMYRSDYDGADQGTPSEMGLPPLRALAPLIHVSCHGRNYIDCSSPNGYMIAWPVSDIGNHRAEDDQVWVDYVEKYGSAAILEYDAGHCDTCPGSPFTLNRGIGLTLGGSVIVRVRRLNPTAFEIFYH